MNNDSQQQFVINPVCAVFVWPPVSILSMSKAACSLIATVLFHCAGAKLPRVAEPSGEAYAQAVTTLLPYLLSHRSRLAAFTASQPAPPSITTSATSTTASQAASTATATSHPVTASQAGTASELEIASEGAADAPSTSYGGGQGQEEEVPGSPVRSRPQEFLASLQSEQRHQLAVLVDTAILKVPPTLAYEDKSLVVMLLHFADCPL